MFRRIFNDLALLVLVSFAAYAFVSVWKGAKHIVENNPSAIAPIFFVAMIGVYLWNVYSETKREQKIKAMLSELEQIFKEMGLVQEEVRTPSYIFENQLLFDQYKKDLKAGVSPGGYPCRSLNLRQH